MGKATCKKRVLCPYLGRCALSRLVMRFQVTMIDKEEKTFEETIVAGNMDEAKKIAKESNPEAKIVSANWVYK